CRAPRRHYKCQPACSCSRNLLKFRSIHVAKQQRTLCPRRAPILFVHTGVNMPVRKKKIEQSIIVVIQETRSPAEKRDRPICNASLITHVREARVAFVSV